MEAVNNHGRAWKKISAQYFPNRSALELSNRWVHLTPPTSGMPTGVPH